MITRHHTSARMSKIVIHNATAYLCGQVGDGADVATQTTDCLARVDSHRTMWGSPCSPLRHRHRSLPD
mgnify:CR=1 FL=1